MAIPLFFCLVANGQSIRYSNFYDSNLGAEILDEAVLLENGSLIIAGKTSNANGSGYGKIFNLVVAEDGSLQHSHVLAWDQATIGPYAIVRTETTGIYEAGTIYYYSGQSLDHSDFFLAKLDGTGDTIFTKVIERPDTSDYLLDIVQTRPNKLLLIGWTYNGPVAQSSAAELMFITVDTLGNELNRVIWGGGDTDYVHSGLVINEDGEVLMTGYTRGFGGGSNGRTWVVKTDSIGNVQWHRAYSDEFGVGSSCTRVVSLADGNFLVVGGNFTYGDGSYGVDGGLLKIDPDGNQIWAKEYEVVEDQGLWDVKELEDGTIVSCGVTMGSDGSQAGWLIKTDSEGEMLWSRTYNPSSLVDFIRFMLVMPNGDIVMLGNGRAPGQTNQDGWVLRVDSEGCMVEDCSVGVEELEEETGYFTAYPNPATTEMTVSINRFDATDMELVVRDMMGKEVLRFRPIGDRSTVDISNWSRGIYHCSLYGNQQLLQTEKLVLMSAP